MTRKIILNIIFAFCFFLISVFFVACVSIKNPVLVNVSNIELESQKKEQLSLNIDFNLYNPNWFSVKAKDVSFNIYIDTVHFAFGSFNDDMKIEKNDTLLVSSTLKINKLKSELLNFQDYLVADIYGSAKIPFYPNKYHFNFKEKFLVEDFTKPLIDNFLSEKSIKLKELNFKSANFSKIILEVVVDFFNDSNISYKIEDLEIEIFSDKNYKNKIGESFDDDPVFIYSNANNELIYEIELDPLSSSFTWIQNKLKGNDFVFVKMHASVNYNNINFPISIKKKLKYNESILD